MTVTGAAGVRYWAGVAWPASHATMAADSLGGAIAVQWQRTISAQSS